MSWQSVEGHDDVLQSFRQAVERGRLAHAYLFVGASGIGKRLFARTLAETLLCEHRAESEFQPCGTCPGCAQVNADSHPDLIMLGRGADEHELPIDTIRRVIHDLGFKSDRGRYKIAIIDDADDLNQASANCFLKCLEEPPPRSLLILIGTSPDQQLPTIRSRCQVVRFQPLSTSLVARVLLQTGVVSETSEADRLAAWSGGSLERAKGLADPELWRFRSELWNALAAPRVDSVRLADAMNALIEARGKESIEKRTRAKLLLGMATEFFDDSLRASAGATTSHLGSSEPGLADNLASRHSPEIIANLIERCLDADYQIDRKGSVPLIVEAWADEVAANYLSRISGGSAT
jgi:DNA polymerase-3 subunit delta'